LEAILRHRSIVLLVFIIVAAATVKMFAIVPKGFIPDQDNDALTITLRAAQGTSFDEMVDNIKKMAAVVIKHPYVEDFFATTGGNAGSMNVARLSAVLTPRKTRPLTAAQ